MADTENRLQHFGDEIDALKQRTFSRVGTEDVAYITRVRAICERHGVRYKTDTWPNRLRRVFAHIGRLSHAEGGARHLAHDITSAPA